MVRFFGIVIGLFFTGMMIYSFGRGAYNQITAPPEQAAYKPYLKDLKNVKLPSDGPLGKFDEQQLQRGFQVYKEVCAACHGIRLVAFRNLDALGYNEDEIKAIAANWPIQTPDIDPDTGEATTRPSLPSDTFPKPFANDVAAAAANNNAIPPDLSLITKARKGGGDYIYSLLTGYEAPPADLPDSVKPTAGLHYNPYFPNLNLAMAPPLVADDQVTYSDGTKATIDQMSKDVTEFLVWTAEPKMEERKQTGWAVIAFLLLATILGYMSFRNVWADVKAQKKK